MVYRLLIIRATPTSSLYYHTRNKGNEQSKGKEVKNKVIKVEPTCTSLIFFLSINLNLNEKFLQLGVISRVTYFYCFRFSRVQIVLEKY